MARDGRGVVAKIQRPHLINEAPVVGWAPDAVRDGRGGIGEVIGMMVRPRGGLKPLPAVTHCPKKFVGQLGYMECGMLAKPVPPYWICRVKRTVAMLVAIAYVYIDGQSPDIGRSGGCRGGHYCSPATASA